MVPKHDGLGMIDRPLITPLSPTYPLPIYSFGSYHRPLLDCQVQREMETDVSGTLTSLRETLPTRFAPWAVALELHLCAL